MTISFAASSASLLHDYLDFSARRDPTKNALIINQRELNFAEIDAQANALANGLRAAGVERGDRVIVFGDNTLETVVSFWGVLKADAVVVMVNPLTKSDKLDYLLKDCRPTAMVTDANLFSQFAEPVANNNYLRCVLVSGLLNQEKAAAIPHMRDWGQIQIEYVGKPAPIRRNIDLDLAAIIYTSGSTGEPKGVMLTHRNMLAAATSISTYLEVAQDEVILNVLPLAFDYGLYQMIMAFRAGASLVLERSFAFPAQILNQMVKHRVTGLPGVPTVFAVLAEMKNLDAYDLSRIRYVTNTAANLPIKHIQRLRELFPQSRIYSMYGLTECKRCTYLPPADLDRKMSSVGIAIPNTELWLVDANGQRVAPGVIGELVIRGATVMKGYWEKPEATARKLRPGPIPGEFVLYTGDYCRLDEEGYLYFVARMDDIIKSRGEKVAPKEVEHALSNIPGVREVAVIGVPDELLGQAIKAFVVLEEGKKLDEKQLQRECAAKLESYMIPKYITFVESLPRTDTGKIKKIGLH